MSPRDAEQTPGRIRDRTGPRHLKNGARGSDGRLLVSVSDQVAAARWLQQEMGRRGLAGLFLRGGTLVHTPRIDETGYIPPAEDGADDGPAQVRPVTHDGLVSMIEFHYNVGRVKANYEGGEASRTVKSRTWQRTLLPRALSIRCLGAVSANKGIPNLRPLHSITHTPCIRPDGSILDQPGYDDATGLLYLPDRSMGKIMVPDQPTDAQVKAARETILYPIGQFPFVTPDDQANWVGAMLTPALRPVAPGPYQFVIIDAPSPGAGKGYLLSTLGAVHRAGAAAGPAEPRRGDGQGHLDHAQSHDRADHRVRQHPGGDPVTGT